MNISELKVGQRILWKRNETEFHISEDRVERIAKSAVKLGEVWYTNAQVERMKLIEVLEEPPPPGEPTTDYKGATFTMGAAPCEVRDNTVEPAKPAPPDFDAMTDAEVVAWAEGWRPRPCTNEWEHSNWPAKEIALGLSCFDSCTAALDAVFHKDGWNLYSFGAGYVVARCLAMAYGKPRHPTPTSAAVAAIRQAMKERTT